MRLLGFVKVNAQEYRIEGAFIFTIGGDGKGSLRLDETFAMCFRRGILNKCRKR